MSLSLWNKAYLAVAELYDDFEHDDIEEQDRQWRYWLSNPSDPEVIKELKRIDEEYSNGV